MTVTLAIPDTPLAWLLCFLFELMLGFAWALGTRVAGKLVA